MNEYKKISYYYDELISEMDYTLWFNFIKPYLKKDSSILDLACGSGTFAILLKLSGYDVEGLDLSSSILEIALEKAKINHLTIPFYHMDMIHFNLEKKYDVITCFFDSVNFIKDVNNINQMISNVYSHLKPNGYFIFDIFSKKLFKEYKRNKVEIHQPTYDMLWKTKKVSKNTLEHHIEIMENDQRFTEKYYEYFHKLKSLNFSQFKLINISGDFKELLKANDERILVVLQAL